MRKLIALLFFPLFLLHFSPVKAQNDLKTLYALARQAKTNGENKKAIDYFEELYSKTNSESYYNELFQLYGTEKDYSAAEKIVKKRIKKFPKRTSYIVDRGHLYELQGNKKEAEKYYSEALSKTGNRPQDIKQTANKFIQYSVFSYAEKAYLKGRKSSTSKIAFRFELANIYARQGKTMEMVDEYLDILAYNRSHIQTVQNIFQRVINPDPDGSQKELLNDKLLRRIQKDPDQDVFSELLIWLYIQDKNFNGAFVQAKALDRRSGELGKRLFSLGQLSFSNQNYDVAEKSYQYITTIGDKSPYFLQAKMKLVEVLKDKITVRNDYTPKDLQQLKASYNSTIDELGKSAFTLSLLRGLAELNAYYLDSVDQGIEILENAISLIGINKQNKAETKIELADLMLLNGETWEASLLYSQVEKEFKYDRLGEIAKYKNAKIAFYTGDFYWAQAQLDVLKGSTSKLIANDALDLSLLITDNVGLDSIAEPLEMYARADLLIFKKNYSEAIVILDSIPKFFPFSSLRDDILFTKYKIAYQLRDYEEAAKHLRELLSDFPEDLLGDNALFNLAKLEEQFGNTEKAMELFKTLLTTYPSSLFVVESRKRFRALRGDQLEEKIN